MDKKIFQDQLPLTRRQLLEDNCTECEKITYPKDFDEQQMAELVRLRPMEAREKQPGLFEGGRLTGTND